MIIGRESAIYRPYNVRVNARFYYLDDIVLYDENGKVCNTGSGWFERKGGYPKDITSIEIDTDKIYLRRKENFDGKVFAMLHKDFIGETRATLYIPADMLGVSFSEYGYDNSLYHVYAVYEGSSGIYIKSYIGNCDGKIDELNNRFNECAKVMTSYSLRYNTHDVISAASEIAKIAKEYAEETERLRSLSLHDALEQCESIVDREN